MRCKICGHETPPNLEYHKACHAELHNLRMKMKRRMRHGEINSVQASLHLIRENTEWLIQNVPTSEMKEVLGPNVDIAQDILVHVSALFNLLQQEGFSTLTPLDANIVFLRPS
jgi:hypothetical protein